eukprot:m.9775 g.9775  ORF g.9775 m.9775 type:complete len:288 (-) comp4130_c0_seq1:117-980(-)
MNTIDPSSYRPGDALRTGLPEAFKAQSLNNEGAKNVRLQCRAGNLKAPTPGLAPGYVQANVVILPKEHAFDFLLFCLKNPRPCPLLDVTEEGVVGPAIMAPDSDITTDVPKYRVWQKGEMQELYEVKHIWRNDLVTFLLGCSFTWEEELQQAGLTPRHIEEGCNVPMYRTNIDNHKVGVFGGKLVISMRPYKPADISKVKEITSKYPGAHGGPLFWGENYNDIGIQDLGKPHYGDAVTVRLGEVPVFWACGVTPQSAVAEAGIDFAITHAPGHMLVCDVSEEDLCQP